MVKKKIDVEKMNKEDLESFCWLLEQTQSKIIHDEVEKKCEVWKIYLNNLNKDEMDKLLVKVYVEKEKRTEDNDIRRRGRINSDPIIELG